VIDILEALKMSLAEGKKPPRSVRDTSGEAVGGEEAVSKPKRGRK
jgi:hypothetical protein